MLNRNLTVDVAKGIGIILVVLGHNWIVLHEKNDLFRVIFSFHVPLFFFISGLFLKDREGIKDFLISKSDSLLKPYFVVLIFIGLPKVFVSLSLFIQ
jgi:polysaccharide biosynthesis protein PslL